MIAGLDSAGWSNSWELRLVLGMGSAAQVEHEEWFHRCGRRDPPRVSRSADSSVATPNEGPAAVSWKPLPAEVYEPIGYQYVILYQLYIVCFPLMNFHLWGQEFLCAKASRRGSEILQIVCVVSEIFSFGLAGAGVSCPGVPCCVWFGVIRGSYRNDHNHQAW